SSGTDSKTIGAVEAFDDVGRSPEPVSGCGGGVGGELPPGDGAFEAERAVDDEVEPALDGLGPGRDDRHLAVGARQAGQGDAVAHEAAAAEDGDPLDAAGLARRGFDDGVHAVEVIPNDW